MELRRVAATRYVAPLREGGSLPGLVEADDDGLYVVKFRGAGQGPAALVAEVVAGELARALGLLVPDLVLAEVAHELALAEPDPEIKDLVMASTGDNLGVDFLPGALPFTPAAPITSCSRAPGRWRRPTRGWRRGRSRRSTPRSAPCPTGGWATTRPAAAPTWPPSCAAVCGSRGTSPRRPRMPARSAFQYAILRVVPSVERGECLNVGVVVHCPQRRFLGARLHLDAQRLAALAPAMDPDQVRPHLDALAAVAAGDPGAGPLARLSASDRFGWIAAPASTVIQPSPIHTGLTDDPQRTLEHLFA